MKNVQNVILGVFFIFTGIVTYLNPQLIVNKFGQPVELVPYYAFIFIIIGIIISVVFYKKIDS